MMVKPMKTLELHYLMIQFLVNISVVAMVTVDINDCSFLVPSGVRSEVHSHTDLLTRSCFFNLVRTEPHLKSDVLKIKNKLYDLN